MNNKSKYSKIVDSPLGNILIESNENNITSISFESDDFAGEENRLAICTGGNETEVLRLAARQLDEYFQGLRCDFTLPLEPQGTRFQQKVWHAIETVPYSETTSYAEIAMQIENPKAYRAVARACGANPYPIVVPCHRIIASDGTLGGYSCGLWRKEFLLSLEDNGSKLE